MLPSKLLINQRIYQAAVSRLNALVARLEPGLTGAEIRPGLITAADWCRRCARPRAPYP